MKKIWLLLLLLIFPLSASALEDSLIVDCHNQKVIKDELITCSVYGYSSYEVSAINASFDIPDDLDFRYFVTDQIWQGTGDINSIDLYTEVNKRETFKVGTVTVVALKDDADLNIGFNSLTFFDKDYVEKVIIEKDVNKTENKDVFVKDKHNNFLLYVIIILIIVIIIILFMMFRKLIKVRSESNEK